MLSSSCVCHLLCFVAAALTSANLVTSDNAKLCVLAPCHGGHSSCLAPSNFRRSSSCPAASKNVLPPTRNQAVSGDYEDRDVQSIRDVYQLDSWGQRDSQMLMLVGLLHSRQLSLKQGVPLSNRAQQRKSRSRVQQPLQQLLTVIFLLDSLAVWLYLPP